MNRLPASAPTSAPSARPSRPHLGGPTQPNPPKSLLATFLRRSLTLLTLIFPFASVSAAETKDAKWYEIELIVFRQVHHDSTEVWPHFEKEYPAEMIFISPNSDSDITPRNIGQLQEVLRYESDVRAPPTGTSGSTENYLFAPSETRPQLNLNVFEENLIIGIDQPVPANESGQKDEDLPFDREELQRLFESGKSDAYRNLPAEEMSLTSISNRLRRSSRYNLLLHMAWRQPVTRMENAIPILVQGGKQYGDTFELDGVMTFSLSRFLHVDTDLWYTAFLPLVDENLVRIRSKPQNPLARDYPELFAIETRRNDYIPVQSYRLVQSRRMRSSTLHLLDHPVFGVLVNIRKFKREPLLVESD